MCRGMVNIVDMCRLSVVDLASFAELWDNGNPSGCFNDAFSYVDGAVPPQAPTGAIQDAIEIKSRELVVAKPVVLWWSLFMVTHRGVVANCGIVGEWDGDSPFPPVIYIMTLAMQNPHPPGSVCVV